MHKITLFTQDIHDNSKSSKCQKSCDPGFAAVLAVISCFGPKPLYFVENGAKVMTKDYLKQVLEPVLDTLNWSILNGQVWAFNQNSAVAYTA